MSNIKKRIFALVEPGSDPKSASSKMDWFDIFIIILICFNIFAVILSTVADIENKFSIIFKLFEVFSIIVFSIEYLLRLWTCTEYSKYRSPLWGRIKYIISPLAIIDLLAILPFYLPMIIPVDLRFLRALRLFRLFRLLKLGRYSKSFRVVGNVISLRRGELLVTVFLIFILLIISSSLLYYVEREAQPDKFSSIPASMWWSVVTLTTVGYGDMFPITTFGKILSSIISFLGIGIFALPAGILGAGFLEELKKAKISECKTCPHCGKKLY